MKKIPLILFCFMLLSCGRNTETKEMSEFSFSVPSNPDAILDITTFIDSVCYLPLESSENILIQSIDNIFLIDSLIIISDYKSGRVAYFNEQGKYIRQLFKRGRGPGEYTSISQSLIDEKNKRIIIYDSHVRKLIYYTLDGELIREINNFSQGEIIRDLALLPDGNFLCYSLFIDIKRTDPDYAGVWIVNPEGAFVKNVMRYTEKYPVIFNNSMVYFHQLSDGKIGFTDGLSGEVYHYDDRLSSYISFIYAQKTALDYPGIDRTDDLFVVNLGTQEKGNYVYSQWLDGNQKYFVTLFSKTDQSFVTARGENFLTSSIPAVMGNTVRNNTPQVITSYLGSELLLSYLESDYLPDHTKSHLQKITEGMNYDEILFMNPVLQFWFIK